ncbi:phosphatidylinositol 4-kinase, putative [Ichthyophthirius multifiliis]|uniref:1-phosphatidylinositol 4-kinase n=1 Tax=Ichthyophthirius multifiliis TaxID=5932 RepID=G0R2G9_ICHMU|nr:phosphatidylinositol 4-kinase, putative [Ichthyophthirius multifiliis]EGR28337.1 phosphatidylinositol 4-kinase, putative [Ichthyophthirius multifiliis]|eukprot:XP_004027682.1 phosphatidylinositol 4-kinase, putative [Ichthyophthirius multifiliis]
MVFVIQNKQQLKQKQKQKTNYLYFQQNYIFYKIKEKKSKKQQLNVQFRNELKECNFIDNEYIFKIDGPFGEHIKYLDTPNKNIKQKQKSLISMFQSGFFTTDMLIEYLYTQIKDQEIHQYLVNKLYTIKLFDLEFYIAEIVQKKYIYIKRKFKEIKKSYLAICKSSELLEKFLVDCSQMSLSLYLKVQMNKQNLYQKIKLYKYIFIYIFMYFIYIYLKITWILQSSQYNTILNLFINNLIKISLYLKRFPETERKQILKEHIEKINNYLHQNRCKYKGISYFQGIVIPFSKNKDQYYNSNTLIRVLDESFTVFNTKKRAPYKIVIETVDMQEIKENIDFFIQLIKNQQKNSQSLQFEQEFQNLNLVKEEVEKDQDKYKGFAKWAEIIQKEEINKQQKFDITKFFQQKKNNNIEQFTIDKLHKMVKQQQEGKDANYNPNKFQKTFKNQQINQFSLQEYKKQENMQKYQRNLSVFNKCFKQKNEIIEKRHSFCFNQTKEKQQKNTKKYRKNPEDLKIYDVIEFFDFLKSNYQDKILQITNIYNYLHYDIIVQNFYQQNPQKNILEIQFPRKFGPWEDIWDDKYKELKQKSPFKFMKSYKLRPLIVKGGDDLRQELIAMQLISKFKQIFDEARIPLYLRPYEIIVVSESSGFIEFLPNTLSIDAIKKNVPNFKNLYEFFLKTFKENFEEAQKKFIESLAGYSIICYLLQIKDRHNGNILIDNQGHIIHIDFGFILSTSPGNVKFETAHFKLINEYVQLMHGRDSEQFGYYKTLMVRGFMELKKHTKSFVNIIQIMMEQSNLQCFSEFDIVQFKERFGEKFTDKEFIEYVDRLIDFSCNRWSTNQYDKFQLLTNGICI